MSNAPDRVLIVDDNPLHLDILERGFVQFGAASIVKATDGYEAKDFLDEARQPFDLMVLDLCLPGFDGFEMLEHLFSCGSKTRIILLSAMPMHILDMAAKLSQSKELNVVATLQKPIEISALMDVVGRQKWPAGSPNTDTNGQ
jgi:CheY-like chemotaxis protein